MRTLRSFDTSSKMLQLFYQSVVTSAVLFAAATTENSDTNKLIRKAGSVLETYVWRSVWRGGCCTNLRDTMENISHPLHATGGHSCQMPSCCTWLPLCVDRGYSSDRTGFLLNDKLLIWTFDFMYHICYIRLFWYFKVCVALYIYQLALMYTVL